MDSGETNLYIMEKKNGKLAMSGNKTLIIKSSANDFERYYSYRMSGNGNEVKEYLKPHISPDNMIWKFVLKIIRRLDVVVPIYTILFGDWWKSISQYDRIIVFDYNATPQMMRRIRKRRPDAELLLWVWNTAPDNIEDFKKYSKIYCFDSSSCEKWNLLYNSQFYFFPDKEILDIQDSLEIVRDIYFIGADKGRLKVLEKLAKTLGDLELKYEFEVLSNRKNKENLFIKILEKPKDYMDIIREISRSKCILEIVKEEQDGISLRVLEALFLNKKLITNNKKIMDYDFYKKENIFILGKDRLYDLKEFLNSPFYEISDDIKRRYSYNEWLKRMH